MQDQIGALAAKASMAIGTGTVAASGIMGLPAGVVGEYATLLGGLSAFGALLLACWRGRKKRE